ncbi:hypothetical protein Cni_G05866 [Canna indica]|uniref:Uncharacterized protein n=1 Tax=Canna indica TaxID=4628 RepID=A0AAQ3JVM1_9LILI|nr:hypothetical protein Cni_G05866 [Canna indica]
MKNRQTTVEWLANYYMESFRRNPDWEVKHMALDFQSKFFIPLPRAKCYRVRTIALKRLRDYVEKYYALLWPYLAELRKALSREISLALQGFRVFAGEETGNTYYRTQVVSTRVFSKHNEEEAATWAASFQGAAATQVAAALLPTQDLLRDIGSDLGKTRLPKIKSWEDTSS